MRSWQRYALGISLGLLGGLAFAVHQVRGGLAAATIVSGLTRRSGPWELDGTFVDGSR